MLKKKKRQKKYQTGKCKKKAFFKRKKNKSKLKFYNCGKKGHFARGCKKPKKVNKLLPIVNIINASSIVLLTKSYPLWTIDSGATNHVANTRNAFMEFDESLEEQNGNMWEIMQGLK